MTTSDSSGNFGSDGIMLELFGAEVDMHLPVLSEGLLALEKGRAGAKEIDSMMRAAHSIKGAARIVGIEAAVRVAHILEDCFTSAKEGRIKLTSDAVDTLLQGVDTLQRVCALQPDPELTEAALQGILDRIATVRDGTATSPPPTKSAPAATTPTATKPPVPTGALAAPAQAEEHTIVLPAAFDDSAAQSLRRELRDLLELVGHGPSRIVVDFGQVQGLTVTAMSVLLSFARDAAGAQPTPAIEAIRVAPALRSLLRIVGLDRAWAMHN